MNKIKLNAYAACMKNGDEQAFAAVYESTKKGVFSYIYSITGDYAVSEELMQDTYVKVKQNISSFKEVNFSAWIIQIARNLAYNHVKRASREICTDDYAPFEKSGYSMDEEGAPVFAAVRSALRDEEAEIVILHVVGGYKHREIAEILKKPLGTVTWTYKNALAKLKAYIEAEEER